MVPFKIRTNLFIYFYLSPFSSFFRKIESVNSEYLSRIHGTPQNTLSQHPLQTTDTHTYLTHSFKPTHKNAHCLSFPCLSFFFLPSFTLVSRFNIFPWNSNIVPSKIEGHRRRRRRRTLFPPAPTSSTAHYEVTLFFFSFSNLRVPFTKRPS